MYHRLSPSLANLLADKSIAKIFFGAKEDIKSIHSEVVNYVDLQKIVVSTTKRRLGLSEAISLVDPRKKQWTKQNFSKKQWWRLRSGTAMMSEPGFVQYAAADAWGTGRAFSWFLKSQRVTTARLKKSRGPRRKSKPAVGRTPPKVEVIDLCGSPEIAPPRKQLKIPLRRAPLHKEQASHRVVRSASAATRRLADEVAAINNCSELISGTRRLAKDSQNRRKKFVKKRKRSHVSGSESVEVKSKKKKTAQNLVDITRRKRKSRQKRALKKVRRALKKVRS